MYLLPKIHKWLYNVPGRPIISNCCTPTEKVSEFLDHHFQLVMKSGKSYVKGTGDFLEKIKSLGKIPEDAFLNVICVFCDFCDFKWYQHQWKTDMRYEYFDISKQFELAFELSFPVNETQFSEALTKNEASFT